MSSFAVEALPEGICALTPDPARAAVFCDADLLADGAEGFARMLEGLLRAAR